MKVRSFYHPRATGSAPAESLREAAKKMRAAGLSCLPVMHGDVVAGIVTERDMVEAMAKGVPPGLARVADYMNEGSVTVELDEECDVAQLKMLAIGCRHLPVVDHGRLVGTISWRDLLLTRARVVAAARVPAAATAATTPGGWPDEPPPDVDSEP